MPGVVDGNRESNFHRGSCTETEFQSNPRWRVDLEEEVLVVRVAVTNRGDCSGDRMNNFAVKIGNSLRDNGRENPKCGDNYAVSTGITKTIVCLPPLFGRYVNMANMLWPITVSITVS